MKGQLIYIKTFSWKNVVPGTASAIAASRLPRDAFQQPMITTGHSDGSISKTVRVYT